MKCKGSWPICSSSPKIVNSRDSNVANGYRKKIALKFLIIIGKTKLHHITELLINNYFKSVTDGDETDEVALNKLFYFLSSNFHSWHASFIKNNKITSKINLDNSKMPLATTFKKSSYILWTMEFPQRQFSINAFWTILMAPLGTLNIPKADRFELMYTDSLLGWNAVHLQVHFKSLFENYIRF